MPVSKSLENEFSLKQELHGTGILSMNLYLHVTSTFKTRDNKTYLIIGIAYPPFTKFTKRTFVKLISNSAGSVLSSTLKPPSKKTKTNKNKNNNKTTRKQTKQQNLNTSK